MAKRGRPSGSNWNGIGNHINRVKRMHTFDPSNLEWLQCESERTGLSMSEILNRLCERERRTHVYQARNDHEVQR